MKPFSIKEYLENPNREVVTREGKPVRILCTDLDDNDYPVAAATKNRHVDRYTADGLFQAGKKTKYDLFFGKEKREGWALIYKETALRASHLSPEIYATKEAAERVWEANPGIECSIVKIQWEEEQ